MITWINVVIWVGTACLIPFNPSLTLGLASIQGNILCIEYILRYVREVCLLVVRELLGIEATSAEHHVDRLIQVNAADVLIDVDDEI